MPAKIKRRSFTAEDKRRILQQSEACKHAGGLGALLRREKLCASHLASWRAQAESGLLAALAPKKRGPKEVLVVTHDHALAEKDREVAKWKRRAEHAEALLEAQRKSLNVAEDNSTTAKRLKVMSAVLQATPELEISSTCTALGVARSTYYREVAPVQGPKRQRPSPLRRVSNAKRQVVWDILHEPRFIGLAPAVIHTRLLDEGKRLCSVRTMHRILAERSKDRNR